jgi:hypothetical protein
MYVNAEMIPIETVSGMWGRREKESCGGGEFKYEILEIF